MKVLYAVSEATPFIATGGLADVGGSLPPALRKRRTACRAVLPLYKGIGQDFREKMQFVTDFVVPLAWRRQYCGVFRLNHEGAVYYFLDNEYYFKRDGLYGHYDDAERFAFFSRAVMELIKHIDFKPDIIHCNDWQTAMIPVYNTILYSKLPGYENIKTVFTIHNIQYQGVYDKSLMGEVLDLDEDYFSLLEYGGAVNLMKGGIECADMVSTVSPTYANEILDPWYSHGLDPILRERAYKLRGILNGIDFKAYDPGNDSDIFFPYSAKDKSGKAKNKAALQEHLGLELKADLPLIGITTRLVTHKGLDLVAEAFENILASSQAQFAILGSGDYAFEEFFHAMAEKYPGRVSFTAGFIPHLARKIYAGVDLFLMPSKSEPCGLSQMVSLRYGTLPIVRETGGLKDSVTDSGDGKGNGFTFKSYNFADMTDAVNRALTAFYDKAAWGKLVDRALKDDNSWANSAGEYLEMYRGILS